MQVTDEVNWGPEDFAAAAALMAGFGVALELVLRATNNLAYRTAVGVALATAFLLIWANAAVGVFSDEGSPAAPAAAD